VRDPNEVDRGATRDRPVAFSTRSGVGPVQSRCSRVVVPP
jgi:hypothetical protein